MNHIIGRTAQNMPRIMVMTAFATVIALAGPSTVFASGAGQPASMQKTSNTSSMQKKSMEETAEDRINYLHKVLQITPDQEDQWNKVAVVIRENADQLTILAKARSENHQNMTAVDDLRSYADFSSAHEDGTRKLIPVFQSLYESMSDPQKKVADMVFRNNGRKGHNVAASSKS